MIYRTCPYCGANLDPGERCSDCNEAGAKPGETANLEGETKHEES